jgi:hypothetical protein
MEQHPSMDRPQTYQIKVQGKLDEGWSDWFSGMTVTLGSNISVLTGPVADQAALRGILTKIWDLNLTLIFVRRIETDGEEESKND